MRSAVLINQILRSHLAKSSEISFPPFPDLAHRSPCLECRAELVPRRETIEAVVAKLKLVRMHCTNRRNRRDRKSRRVVTRAIRNAESQTTQRHAAILAIGRPDRSERGRLNLHAKGSRRVEPCQHRVGIEPGSANHLKRHARPSPHRHVRSLEQTRPRIMKRALEARHVGRRFDPRHVRLVIEHGSRPAGHRDDHQVGTDPQDVVGHASELAQCHPVTHGDGKKTNKGGVRIARLRTHVSLHGKAADGVRPIQHDHPFSRARKRVIVLDRPDPIGGLAVQGNVRAEAGDPDSAFVGFLPIAMRHGMTLGELARMTNDVLGIGADLVVVPVAGWSRSMFYDQTNIPWVKPSPNMPSLESAFHYPGTCLFEGTNVSVGRGTGMAFQVIGAPWLNPDSVLARLDPAAALGVEVQATAFTPVGPTDGKYGGVPLRGLRLRVADRARYDPTRLAVASIAAIRAVHPNQFQFRNDSFDRLAAGHELRAALEAGRPMREILERWEGDLARFREVRAKYLIY